MKAEQTSIKREKNFFVLLKGILWHPGATLRYLSGTKRRWWALLALLALAAGALQGVAFRLTDAEYRHQQQTAPREQVPKSGMEPTRAEYATPHPLTIWVPVLGQVLGQLASWLLWAGAFYLAGTFFGQNGSKFGALLAMDHLGGNALSAPRLDAGTLHVYHAATYLQSGSGRPGLGQRPKVDAVEGVPIMPQLPATGQLVAAALLGRVDIYLIWHIWLLVLGLVAFVKLSRKKALLITLGIWLIFTLPTLLPALLGLGQGGMAF